MAHLTFITSNAAKVALAAERLRPYGVSVEQASLELEEVQSFDVVEVATNKARHAMSTLKSPFFVEDSGFYINALKGFPGPLIKPIIQTLGEDKLTGLVGPNESRDVEVLSVLVLANPIDGTINTFQGSYLGTLATQPRGDHTRGWLLSRLFIPQGWNATLAELNETEWGQFLDDFRQNDHFDKLGKWLSEQEKQTSHHP